ncbi:MAG: membrane-bound PQQ-dependent dehydrogenase, glucose/quinate/shikimate family [Sphingomonadaceae bacterium]|nr:membrane-bound PQQ-dependent dehydrogenase, glucose/quinate/shikimate family [Sphingomonadaceae bacterium]
MNGVAAVAAGQTDRRWGAGLLGTLLGAIGLWLAGGGAWLLSLGGSAYYLLAGAGCGLAAAFYFSRRERAAMAAYLAVFAGTCIWALAEIGTDFWQLVPRVGGPAVMAAIVIIHWQFSHGKSRRIAWSMSALAAIAFAVLLGSITGLPSASGAMLTGPLPATMADDWAAFGKSQAGTRYSRADQITPENIGSLEVAWTLRTGDLPSAFPDMPGALTFEATPLKVGELIYLCTPHNLVIAADADTGKERWRFDPKLQLKQPMLFACRGVSYAQTGDEGAQCASRIIYPTLDARLIALDALTGEPCSSFGSQGMVDMTENLGEVPAGSYVVTSPPAIANGVAIVGSFVIDGKFSPNPSGVIRGYDVVTGERLWAWDASSRDENRVPGPGEQYTRGAVNSWTVSSADPELGLVYLPLGNVSPDFAGWNRTAEEERYTSSVVALDTRTGKRRWHFQTVHHDLWDYDVPAQPVLFDMPVPGGGTRPALAQPTKQGEIFILDRRTGKPLTEVEEQPVPQGDVPLERYSPTQPVSTGFASPFSPEPLTEKDMWGATPLDQLYCRIRFRSARYDGRFTPPSTDLTLQHPGNYGIMNWGSVTIGNGGKTMLVNSSHLAMTNQLTPYAGPEKGPPGHAEFAPQRGTAYAAITKVLLSPLGIPCNAPPWGKLTAIDLTSRKIAWQRPFGTTRDHAPLGIAVPGAPNMAGSVATAGGVLFIGASIDNYLRAYDTKTGAELWRTRLPAGGQASPISYVSEKTGKQYVLIAAGGHQMMDTALGDYVIAYALPDGKR